MFSSLTKLADKNFVIGFLLPALLGVLLFGWVAPKSLVGEWAQHLGEKTPTEYAYLAVVIYVISLFLMIANYSLYRLLEGYIPPTSWLAGRREKHRRRAGNLLREYVALRGRWTALTNLEKTRAARLRRALIRDYPIPHDMLEAAIIDQKALEAIRLLPTMFGNRILSFEYYAWAIYRADPITVWPRLQVVLPASLRDDLNSEQAVLNLLLNGLLIAAGITCFGLLELGSVAWSLRHDIYQLTLALRVDAPPMPEQTHFVPLLRPTLMSAAGAVASVVSYYWAVAQVPRWGDQVKTAFDCYLPTLQKQLGYSATNTEKATREFWEQVSGMTRERFPLHIRDKDPEASKGGKEEPETQKQCEKKNAEGGKEGETAGGERRAEEESDETNDSKPGTEGNNGEVEGADYLTEDAARCNDQAP